MKSSTLLLISCLVVFLTGAGMSQSTGSFGIRGGVGTDITGGIAYGGGINYQFPVGNNWMEVGPIFYAGHFEETTEEEINTYEETTDLTVFGVMANFLLNYHPNQSGVFFVVGAGFAAASVEWEEKSDTDVSLGTPLPGGGSKQTADGTAGGTVLNVGAGYNFGKVDLRAEIPVIIIAGAPGEASAVAPTFTATLGIRF